MRILLLADTHLGFDYPGRSRLTARHRGPDFFGNFQAALGAATREKVDCVVHGGDLLFRSRVKAGLVEMALRPLKELASQGIPVYLVPGNHERSRIPFGLLARHPGLFVFDRPRTFVQEIGGCRVAFAGFPFQREQVRRNFRGLVAKTRWEEAGAEVRFLCLHQCVEGATVGPSSYTFRSGGDVIRSSDLTGDWCAVLAGHIHRAQVLTTDVQGRPLPTTVLYPGSIERTSQAERDEEKGFFILEVDLLQAGGRVSAWKFRGLPARPMFSFRLSLGDPHKRGGMDWLKERLSGIPPDSVVQIELHSQEPLDRDALWEEIVQIGVSPAMSLRIRWQESTREPAGSRSPGTWA